MQVFKAFFRILYKNKTSLFMYIAIYLALTLLISNVLNEKSQTEFSGISLDVALENRDRGSLGKVLETWLEARHHITDIPEQKEDLQDAMYYQELDYVLVIPEDFTEKLQNGTQEGVLEGTMVPKSSSACLIEQEVDSFLKTVSMYLRAGSDVQQAAQWSIRDLEKKAQVEFLEKDGTRTIPSEYYFFQYIPYVFLIMMILGVRNAMKAFKNKDLAARNKCSSMSFLKQNMQIFLGCMVYMALVYVVFLGMACLNTGGSLFTPQGLLRAVNALVFGVCALCVAWFAVQFARNAAALNVLSNIFGLGFSFLGGVFVSLDMMGERARQIARFIPSYWYVKANEEILNVTSLSGAGTVYRSYLMVLMFSLVFFSAGLLVHRLKLRGR